MSQAATAALHRNVENLADQLKENGFLFVNQLASPNLVASVRSVSVKRLQAIRSALGSRDIGIGSANGFEEIVQRSPGRWDVPVSMEHFDLEDHDLPWWPLIAAVLGANAEPSFSGVVSSDPATPDQYWHSDSPHLSAEHMAPHAINVMMALHTISMQMGPTEFACGSHKLTNHLSNTGLNVDELVYQHSTTTPALLVSGTDAAEPERAVCAMPAGSYFVFDDRVLHRGLGNRSNEDRHMAYFSYRKKGYVGTTHFESQRSVFDATNSV